MAGSSAGSQFAARAAKVNYRRLEPRALGLLRAGSGQPRGSGNWLEAGQNKKLSAAPPQVGCEPTFYVMLRGA